MAQDVNGKALKVGDRVKALTDGGYDDEFIVGGVYEVTSLSDVSNRGVRIGRNDLFMYSHEIKLVEEATKKGSDMFKFKVGDKVVLKEAGVIGRTAYVAEILNRVSEYGFLEVTEVGVGVALDGYTIALEGDYYRRNQLWVDQSVLDDYCVLKQESKEPKLTPKLIESLDELQVGDYFLTQHGSVLNITHIDKSCDYPVATDESAYNLKELTEMGAYKVRVEPYEMVEVGEVEEETKPKLYELVEGEDYVKLEIGDVVKFADGNTHKVHAVDEDDHPYCMYFMGDSWWVEAHYFLPENIISINGVNIHEEYVGDEEITADPYEGWVEGAKVRCLKGDWCDYIEGSVYTLGYCNYEMGNDFGVLTNAGRVYKYGCLQPEYDVYYVNGDIFKCFELIKE